MREYFKLMLASDSGVSSKRFAGLMCFLIYFLIFITTYFVDLTPGQITMSNTFIYVGASLLGATVFEKFAHKNNK